MRTTWIIKGRKIISLEKVAERDRSKKKTKAGLRRAY